MAKEIERKFLIKPEFLENVSSLSEAIKNNGEVIKQGYIHSSKESVVRIRVKDGSKINSKIESIGLLTIKGSTVGISKDEYEYIIPIEDAEEMLKNLCPNYIDKERYVFETKGSVWEIDFFHGDNEGLVIAEIELESEDQEFEKPEWLGDEVSHDPRYFNNNLIDNPFKNW